MRKPSVAALSRQCLPAQEAGDAVIGHQPLERLAGVLTVSVGAMQKRVGFAPAPDGHNESIGHECRHRSAHRPADHAPGEKIDDRRHIKPTFRGPVFRLHAAHEISNLVGGERHVADHEMRRHLK